MGKWGGGEIRGDHSNKARRYLLIRRLHISMQMIQHIWLSLPKKKNFSFFEYKLSFKFEIKIFKINGLKFFIIYIVS